MDFPSEGRGGAHLSPEILDKMTAGELQDALDKALDSMDDETYDHSVITAYLDALERKNPLPRHPSAQESYEAFRNKLSNIVPDNAEKPSNFNRGRPRARRILRSGLIAAVIAVSLFLGMIAAQAAGVDVFGAIARWTDSVFSFGEIEPEHSVSATAASTGDQLPPSAREAIEAYLPQVPSDFVAGEPFVYFDHNTNNTRYSLQYTYNTSYIQFEAIQGSNSRALYEKDNGDVLSYSLGNITYYIFSNYDNSVAAWYTDEWEYSISTNLSASELTNIIMATYKEH